MSGVAVVMRGGLGDIVLAQRPLAALKERLDGGDLCVVAQRYADLFLCSKSVDRVIMVDGGRAAGRLQRQMQADGVAVYNLDHPFKGVSRERRGTLHIVERLDELLGTSTSHLRPVLDIPPVFLDCPHAVLTWASSAEKKLPKPDDRISIWNNFRTLCESFGIRPIIASCPTDDVLPEFVAEGSLLHLCGLIRGADLYCGCDTGFSHVASTAAVPSVICHIGYPVARCGVKNQNADILYSRDNDAVDLGAVFENLARRLADHGKNPLL